MKSRKGFKAEKKDVKVRLLSGYNLRKVSRCAVHLEMERDPWPLFGMIPM